MFDIGAKDVAERFENYIILNLELGARKIISEKIYVDTVLNFGIGLLDINNEEYRVKDHEMTINLFKPVC